MSIGKSDFECSLTICTIGFVFIRAPRVCLISFAFPYRGFRDVRRSRGIRVVVSYPLHLHQSLDHLQSFGLPLPLFPHRALLSRAPSRAFRPYPIPRVSTHHALKSVTLYNVDGHSIKTGPANCGIEFWFKICALTRQLAGDTYSE